MPFLMEHRGDASAVVRIRGGGTLPVVGCTEEAVRDQQLDVVFLATPPEASMELVPVMLAGGARVVDLGGAFRLRTTENYAAWYKQPHTQPALLAEAVYGLP